MAQRETIKTSWVYSLRKDELVNYLTQCDQDTAGTVEEMRKRLSKFITADHDELMARRLLEWQKQHEQGNITSPSISIQIPDGKEESKFSSSSGRTQTSCRTPTPEENINNLPASPSREDRIAKIELVRKWGLKYDGGKDALKFIDRLEELAAMYGVDLSDVVPVMFELLKDRALIWFRNNRKPWEQWQQFKRDFLSFFLSPRYFEKLEDDIRKRTQRPRENFKDYVLNLQELMYHSQLNEEEKLGIIFRNSLPDYQWYIKRKDFKSLDDLLSLADDLESIPTTTASGRNEHHRLLRDEPSLLTLGVSGTTNPRKPVTSLSWEEEKLKAIILLDQRPSPAIVDTGATRSFMTPSFVRQMRWKPRYTPSNIEVALADGSKRRIYTTIEVPVTFGNLTKNHEFLIMKEATEAIILGIDFLRAFNTTIQCAGLGASCGAKADMNTRNAESQNQVRELSPVHYGGSYKNFVRISDETVQQRIKKFLETELPKFQEIKGLSTAATHRIIMKDERPIKIRYAPRNPAMQAIIDEEVNSLLSRGCIEPSHSPYSFPITLVKKKNGSWRTCMDFRQLNARSVPDAYPLPRIDAILDKLRHAKYISSLDLKDGYWQIPMDEESKKYTAFAVTGRGLYQWRVMPFGLHSAPATFQRALDSVIGPDLEPHAFAYLDDIIIIGKTLEEHMNNLREVFRRLRSANLKINVDKCEFFKSETRYLGHIVTSEGIKTDPEKIAAIAQLPTPQDTKGVRRFLGITSWYRRFVPNFAKISQPLTQLLKKGRHWKWGKEQQEAFEELKDCLTKSPVLACPDFSKPFTLQTDASDCGLGAVLTQEIDGGEHVIAYASRHLNGAEKNYSATEKECLAIIWGIRKMRSYLEGYEFQVITDHLSLKWLNSIDNPTGRLARWALELQQYQFSISYRKGKQNTVADALSRHPVGINMARTQSPNTNEWYDVKMDAVRKCPEQHAEYTIVDQKLYRHFEREINDEDNTPWKLCVPIYQRQRVLAEAHDKITGGHMGIRKTLNKVASRYYWPGMAHDVRRHVRNCEACQRYKISQQQPAGKMLTRIPEEPWSLLCADFIGPLPRTPHGNTMLLVLFDHFSKWVELIPLRKATAEGVVKALRERIVSRYGVPKVLITDNGTQFTSRNLKRYLEEIGVKQQYTAPYTPQENPTERANRTIKTIIAQFSGERHNHWDEVLPEIMLAINTSESESTGYSPAFLTQGRNPRLPKALYDEVTIGSGAKHLGPEERGNEMTEIFKIVRRNMEKASQKQRHHYNLRRRDVTFQIGDRVLVRQHPLSKAIDNFAAKLAPKFKGPYIIMGFVSPVIIELRAVESSEKRIAHISELKHHYSNNEFFSLTTYRFPKPARRRRGKNMDPAQKKFEETREKFRRNMKKEKEAVRRTIFLTDDDIPSTSHTRFQRTGRRSKKKNKPKQPDQNATPKRPETASFFQINIVTPPKNKPNSRYTSDEDEEVPPPPPPLHETQPTPTGPKHQSYGEESRTTAVPPSPIWEDEYLILDDFDIDPADLSDPLILEFYRTFWGMNDTTVDTRPLTPPPPPSPVSSIDWENENFRPPTPPRRKGYGSLDVQDSQYQYLGMQCYERIWRARLLVPRGRPVPALPESSSPLNNSPGTTTFSDPERKTSAQATNDMVIAPKMPSRHSPIPPPPPMPRTTILAKPLFEQLPIATQQQINQKRENNKGKRLRFKQVIWQHEYRVSITPSGDVRITLIKEGEQCDG